MGELPRRARPGGGLRHPARAIPALLLLLLRHAARRPSSAPAPSCWCAAPAPACSTVALAGSTRRSSDPAVDDHLGEQLLRSDKNRREQRIVAERIVRALRPHAVWVEAAAEPEIVKVANIQHLATPVIAQLAEPHSAIELAGLLHPTPAVGGEPWPEAATAIAELEQMDRGWYAGPVGWMDATEDGEFCVALRSAVAPRPRGPPLRRRRRRRRLRPGRRAGRDRGQARRAAAVPGRVGAFTPHPSLHRMVQDARMFSSRRVALAGLLAVIMAAGATATGALAAEPEGPRLLTMALSGLGSPSTPPSPSPVVSLETISPAGGAMRVLARGKLSEKSLAPNPLTSVSWSGDGKTVAFAGGEAERARIYVVSTAGGGPRPVPGTRQGLNPVLSPDGGTIAFTRSKTRYRVDKTLAGLLPKKGRRCRRPNSPTRAPRPGWSMPAVATRGA